MTGQDWMEKDFYRTLGVAKDADAPTIKKAYRKLARLHHPDQNKGDAAAEQKFKAIGEAYEVLSDPKKRRQYDAIRAMAGGGPRFHAGGGGGRAGGFEDMLSGLFGGGGGGRFNATPFGMGGGQPNVNAADFADILGNMFGQQSAGTNATSGFGASAGSPFGAPTSAPKPQRGADLTARCSLTLQQAVAGATIKMRVNDKQLTVRIPAGVHDGRKIRVKGRGKPGSAGGENGDLIVTVHVTPDEFYEVRGGQLYLRLPITIAEAVAGADIRVKAVDGSPLTVRIKPGASSGDHVTIPGHGVALKPSRLTGAPRFDDLIVELSVVAPKRPSREQKAAAAAFAQTDMSVRAQLMADSDGES